MAPMLIKALLLLIEKPGEMRPRTQSRNGCNSCLPAASRLVFSFFLISFYSIRNHASAHSSVVGKDYVLSA